MTAQFPQVGLVTVLFKSDGVLDGFFKSISIQSYKNYILYIIDNSPSEVTDALLLELSLKYPITQVEHIKNSTNVGVATGNNQGIQRSLASACTHTLLLNNDIEFDQEFLFQHMVDRSVNAKESLIIPKIYYFDTGKIWMAGGYFERSKGLVHHVGDGKDDGVQYSQPSYFEYAPTCFMLIDNDVFNKVGLMDEAYFVYYDDADFILRAIRAGYKIYYDPKLKVLHKVSSSTGGGESLFSIYYTNRNRIYYLRKNFNGLAFLIPALYTLLTRCARYVAFQKAKKKELFRAVRDGFKMETSQ